MNNNNTEERSYIAFISYRHLPLDREAAVRIQKKIENYVVPGDLREKAGGRKLGVCFRDEDELPASSNLSDSITYALDHTQYLIVICTPDLPKSKWCLQEVSYFLQTHDRDHVLAVLADGRPEESFPEQLRFAYDEKSHQMAEVEPLAANIAGEDHQINNKAFKKEVTRLIAAMLGCPFDTLWQRERRARTNRLLAAMGAGIAAMAVVMGIVLSKNAQISRQNTQILEQNDQIREQVDQISEQNSQISEQNTQLQKQMSTVLVDSGRMRLDSFYRKGALSDALEALSSNDPAVYDHRAERLLADALGAYGYHKSHCEAVFKQNTDIEQLAVTEDGSIAFTADAAGTVRALEADGGAFLWEHHLAQEGVPSLYPVEQYGLLLCKDRECVTALSFEFGQVVWEYRCSKSCSMQILSGDRSLFAILDQGADGSSIPEPTLLVLNTADGSISAKIPVRDEELTVKDASLNDAIYSWGGTFSDDGSRLLFASPARKAEDGTQQELLLLADLQRGELTKLGTFSSEPDMVLASAFAGQDGAYFCLVNGAHMYSILIPFDPSAEKTIHVYDYSMSSQSGLAGYDYMFKTRPYLPALISDGLAVVFSASDIYLMDLSDGTLLNSLDLNANVITAAWVDRGKEIFQVVTEAGWSFKYDVSSEGDLAIESLYGEDTALSKVNCAVLVRNGHYVDPDSGATLAVMGDAPRQIITVRKLTDPALIPLEGTALLGNFWHSQVSPSGKRVFFFVRSEEGAKAAVYDTETGRQIAVVPFPAEGSFYNGSQSMLLVADDEHFIQNGICYGLDGSVRAFTKQDDYSQLRRSVLRADGTLLTARQETAESGGQLIFSMKSFNYQLGEDPGGLHKDLEDTIVMVSDDPAPGPEFYMGKNGWLAGYGLYSWLDDDGVQRTLEEPRLVVQDTHTGEKRLLTDQSCGHGHTHLALSNKDPRMACVWEDGRVEIFDLAAGSGTVLPVTYAYGEIRTIAFSDQDEYFLVYTAGGHLDCYDMDTLVPVCSEDDPFPLDPGLPIPNQIAAHVFAEEKRLLILARYDQESGCGTLLDTEAWISVSQVEHLCGWSASGRKLLLQTDDSAGLCPLHDIEELKSWADAQLK